jgi:hypothetical protein
VRGLACADEKGRDGNGTESKGREGKRGEVMEVKLDQAPEPRSGRGSARGLAPSLMEVVNKDDYVGRIHPNVVLSVERSDGSLKARELDKLHPTMSSS